MLTLGEESQDKQASGGKIEELVQQLQKAVKEIKDVKEIFQQER